MGIEISSSQTYVVEQSKRSSARPDAADQFQQSRRSHWDKVARKISSGWKSYGGEYQRLLAHNLRHLIPPGMRVLELGCGTGELLAALQPSFGLGVDFSGEMIRLARANHTNLQFVQADAHFPPLQAHFDVIILSDLVNDVWDVQEVFDNLLPLVHLRTRLILTSYSHLWEVPLKLVQRMGLSKPNLEQSWFTIEDIQNLLNLTGFDMIHRIRAILLPIRLAIISEIANRFLVKLWPFNQAALTNILVVSPHPENLTLAREPSVSVIVPARNEAGNITELFERLPEMGRFTEIVFVEGGSNDNTYAVIQRLIDENPNRRCKLLKQKGKGKGDAVRLGLECSAGDLVLILDSDLTVSPETMPRFFEALATHRGEFINGVRLVYPMEDQAMRVLNKTANKLFSLAFSWLLGQPVKDTLCGTKAFWREDYELIAANRSYFGDFDPFGDFDLLFGAARLNLRIVDVPIRYRARTYGTTNIHRWRHGWLLIRMVLFAARRLKFV